MKSHTVASAPLVVTLDARGRERGKRAHDQGHTRPTKLPSRTLVELIGADALQSIQTAFATAFDLPTVILDHDGREISQTTHRVAFCDDLTRRSRAGARCTGCDRGGMRISAATLRPTIFRCWNRLYDCTVPIVSGRGELFGYFLSGQVLGAPEQGLDRFREVAREHGIDEDAYAQEAARLRVMPLRDYARSIECIGVLARMIGDQASAALRHRDLLDSLIAAQRRTTDLAAEIDVVAGLSSSLALAGDRAAAAARLVDALERVVAHDSVVVHECGEDGALRPLAVRGTPEAKGAGQARGERCAAELAVERGAAVLRDEALAVPLLVDREVVGAIELRRRGPAAFGEHDRDLLTIVAGHLAWALGAASLRRETLRVADVVREHRIVLDTLATGISGEHLLDEMCARALTSFRAEQAALRIADADGAERVARRHLSAQALAQLERRHAGALEQAAADGRPVALRNEDTALMIVPVALDGRDAGRLMLARREPFSELETSLAQSFALQLVLAIERTEAQQGVRAAARRARLLAQLTRGLTTAPERRALVEGALRAHELVDGHASALALWGDVIGGFEVWTAGTGGGSRARTVATAGRPELRFPATAPDAGDHEAALDAWGGALAEAIGAGARRVVAAPLWRDGELRGALVVTEPHRLDEGGRALLRVFAMSATAGLARLDAPAGGGAGEAAATAARQVALARVHDAAHHLLALDDPARIAQAAVQELRAATGAESALLAVRERDGTVRALEAAPTSAVTARRLIAHVPADWPATHATDEAVAGTVALADGRRLALVAAPPPVDAHGGLVAGGLLAYAAAALERAWRLAELNERAAADDRARRAAGERIAGLERSLERMRLLGEAALADDGLERIAELLASDGGAAAAYDAAGRRLAAAGAAAELLPLELLPGAEEAAAPAGTTQIAIEVAGERLGWIALAGGRAPWPEQELAASATAAGAVLRRERERLQADARVRGEFLGGLLATETPGDATVRRAAQLGWDVTRVSAVAVADLGGHAVDERCAAALVWAAAREERLLAGRRGEELLVVGPVEGEWPEELHRLLGASGPARVGVGPSTASEGYQSSYLAARRAVDALGSLEPTGFLRIEDDRLEELLLRTVEPQRLATFVQSVLGPLEAYDRERDSELRHTLALLCDNGWNVLATARAAHVHHSTLRYRLARISELTGLDLGEQEGRLAAQLALLVSRLVAV